MANTAAIYSERGGQLSPEAARTSLCRETKIQKLRLRNVAVFLDQLLADRQSFGRLSACLCRKHGAMYDFGERQAEF